MDTVISQTIDKLTQDAILPRVNLKPALLIIYRDKDKAAISYIKSIKKAASQYNIAVISEPCKSITDATNAIIFYKTKPCDGVLIASDFGLGTKELIDLLPHRLDIDSQSASSRGFLYGNTSPIAYRDAPCTAVAAFKILQTYFNNNLCGKKIAVIGRSLKVGRPLAEILLQQDATVTLFHSKSSLQDYFPRMSYDVIISAIGKPKFFNSRNLYLTESTDNKSYNPILIDVGINVDENGKLCGDFDYNDVVDKVPYITPVPNGVGKVTTAVLLAKTLQAKANFLGGA